MEKTIDIMKQKRSASEEVKQKVKDFNKIRREILNVLKEKPKSIPEIVSELDYPADTVTFYLMSLRKFGKVEVDSIDDMDEYFFYKLTK